MSEKHLLEKKSILYSKHFTKTIDRFATFTNAHLPLYNSRYFEPGSSSTDALAQLVYADHKSFVNALSHLIPSSAYRSVSANVFSWEPSNRQAIKQLRLKSINLLALTLMLQPSDIALGVWCTVPCLDTVYNTPNYVSQQCLRQYPPSQYEESGFEVHLPWDDNALFDPVSALHTYITHMEAHRPSPQAPVFNTLQPTFSALQINTITNIMEKANHSAGLGNQGYSAKSFRPIGATAAIGSRLNPEIVMKLVTGRLPLFSEMIMRTCNRHPITLTMLCSTTASSDNTLFWESLKVCIDYLQHGVSF